MATQLRKIMWCRRNVDETATKSDMIGERHENYKNKNNYIYGHKAASLRGVNICVYIYVCGKLV